MLTPSWWHWKEAFQCAHLGRTLLSRTSEAGAQPLQRGSLTSVLFGSPSMLPSLPALWPVGCLSYLLWTGVFCSLTQSPESLTLTKFTLYNSFKSCKPGTLSHLLVVKTITWLRAHKQRVNNGPGLCYLLVHTQEDELCLCAPQERWLWNNGTHKAEGKRGWFLWLFLSGHLILVRSLIDIIYFINSACDDLRVFLVAVKWILVN